MIENSTVFILGAGASWHYGYPTGDELVEQVILMADKFSSYCTRRIDSGEVVQVIPEYVEQRRDSTQGIRGAIEAWKKVHEECQLLIKRLQAVRPLLIDHFLAWNESLRAIGRLMVAAVILECEAAKGNRKPWHRFIVHKLVYGCSKSADLFNNDVHFITFNYDASIEYNLYAALTSVDIIKKADAQQFLTNDIVPSLYQNCFSAVSYAFVAAKYFIALDPRFQGMAIVHSRTYNSDEVLDVWSRHGCPIKVKNKKFRTWACDAAKESFRKDTCIKLLCSLR